MSLHATLDTRSPTTSTSTSTLDEAVTDRSLRQLEQVTDEFAVETRMRSFLARRRAVRQARREQAAAQARHEHELLVQRALHGSGLAHLR